MVIIDTVEPPATPASPATVNKVNSLPIASVNSAITMTVETESPTAMLPTINEDDSSSTASTNRPTATAPDATNEQNDPFHTVSPNVSMMNTVVTQVRTTQILTRS
ncbi:hypothetical protein VKT23_011471 [Stygiomarasmius scandens]|uniref:Uncharacterized protein n=1 Tax=Marasmiellus scandens TaxID=2682957 RepID=A0ABR1JAZ3_9AGAR